MRIQPPGLCRRSPTPPPPRRPRPPAQPRAADSASSVGADHSVSPPPHAWVGCRRGCGAACDSSRASGQAAPPRTAGGAAWIHAWPATSVANSLLVRRAGLRRSTREGCAGHECGGSPAGLHRWIGPPEVEQGRQAAGQRGRRCCRPPLDGAADGSRPVPAACASASGRCVRGWPCNESSYSGIWILKGSPVLTSRLPVATALSSSDPLQ